MQDLPQMDLLTVVSAIGAFGLVLSLWLAGMLVWMRKRAKQHDLVAERLQAYGNQTTEARTLRLWHESGEVETTVIDESKPSLWTRMRRVPIDAGWSMDPGMVYALLFVGCFATFFLLFLITGKFTPSIVAGLTVLLGFQWWGNFCISRNEAMFERQLIDGLELCARALRAGHPLMGSFELITKEIPAPVGKLFGEICQQQQMGVSLEEALRQATKRTPNADLKLFSASLAINMRSGGNLAEVVDGIARVIRDRMRLNRRFRVLISQTQFSKRILLGMPVLMFFVLNLINPGYMARLYDERVGNILLALAGGGMLAGWWVMNKMSTLET